MKVTLEQRRKSEKLIETLVSKARESAKFKERFINNSKEVLEEALNIKFPSEKEIIVEDQTDSSKIYLNIPQNINISDLELTEEELERVSGGIVCGGLCVLGIIAGVVAISAAIGEFGSGWDDYE